MLATRRGTTNNYVASERLALRRNKQIPVFPECTCCCRRNERPKRGEKSDQSGKKDVFLLKCVDSFGELHLNDIIFSYDFSCSVAPCNILGLLARCCTRSRGHQVENVHSKDGPGFCIDLARERKDEPKTTNKETAMASPRRAHSNYLMECCCTRRWNTLV